MAIKKSELYSSLWASCDKLRGSMEPSQYKDYVLVLLFVKYVSDKYANDPNGLIKIPKGGGFSDLQALKGQKDIGEKMDIAISALAKENDLEKVIDNISFQDDEKLGKGKEMVDKLTDLIAIFENPSLDFSKNRAEGDDILGDAYEYLMRHFASESGKSKGEFYTPAEVSRVLAKVIGVTKVTKDKQTVYDPTCGSGSLLLKVAEEAESKVNLYGQEKETSNAALARMNMILHNNPEAVIEKGQSTMSVPLHTDKATGKLKTFDFVVANPPFSSKNWMDGFDPTNDLYNRFESGKIPPAKNGDYAFLLHIIKSLKSKGKGACILPHGVLFRGNVESEIRKSLIEKGYIKGIIGLPANLFYGTGIPACVIVIDMENAEATKDLSEDERGIFMVDASKGFIKDGNKNRLREQDIHKITDIFNKQIEVPKFSRFVSYKEISDQKNDFNLNIPRYIDSQEIEDIQDIEAHLLGGIPNADIDALQDYWKVYPSLRKQLFKDGRKGYSLLTIEHSQLKNEIFSHPEFVTFSKEMDDLFTNWKKRNTTFLKALAIGVKPKQTSHSISEDILQTYTGKALMDKYDVYQHLMNYWNEVMQDDCYLIAVDGWKAEPYRILTKNKAGKETDKGWDCDLVPKSLVINRYFLAEKKAIEKLEAERETLAATTQELEEEHSGEEGYFSDYDKVNKANVQKRLKELVATKPKAKKQDLPLAAEAETSYGEQAVLEQYLDLTEKQTELNKKIKEVEAELDKLTLARYKTLTDTEIKQLVVDDKWMASIERSVKTEMERISQRLTQRIKELTERYETPLPKQTTDAVELEDKVSAHLQKMGFVWS
ncbi:class I SAM-dependent DNA methyltransferase [Aurantibacillus circumpalustris]|uniref:class I SAM-dependent DNA methyltransferase n=1 Tax=Aurantibacillus circumpalustris TaxID=3036359 RepID=UPI00295BE6BD|nr:class I SAM-dependent DNA methyltransferase [Aurantibacillus circumpalustris]